MPRSPRNDGDDPAAMLGEAMVRGPSEAIEASEARGQAEMVNAETVPVDGSDKLVDLGFVLGPVVKDDPIFREAKLPEGWKREPTGHSMHSVICDERGFQRVGIFYKAAFYDRHAHVYLEPADQLKTGPQARAVEAAYGRYQYPDWDLTVSVADERVTITRRALKLGEDGRPSREWSEEADRNEWVTEGESFVSVLAADGSEVED